MTTPQPAVDRPSWAVMAPAAVVHFPIGKHSVFWTSQGDRYRCPGCRTVRTMDEFEADPVCQMEAL